MSATLSYTLKDSLLHINTRGIWRLTEGSSSDHKENSAQQDEIVNIILSKKCSQVIFEYTDSQELGAKNKISAKTPKNINKKTSTNKETWDGLLLAFFATIKAHAKKAHIVIDDSQLPEKMIKLLDIELLESDKAKEPEGSILVNIGELVLDVPNNSINAINFLGEVTAALWNFVRGQASCSARDVWEEIYSCSVASLPIISLVSLLLGLIFAFVSALQLEVLGAELYVSSLVSISMVRIMAPVLAGIVVAGRTGASYAATIGTMQVNEEVDALNTFGISPIEFLVLPRVLGLTIMMPFLAMYANLMGVLGGFLVVVFGLDISPAAFVANVQSMASIHQLWIGLFHAFIFGFVVSFTGCYQGLICGRSAEAVGKATTSAVVNAIVGIIVATSIITIVVTANGM